MESLGMLALCVCFYLFVEILSAKKRLKQLEDEIADLKALSHQSLQP